MSEYESELEAMPLEMEGLSREQVIRRTLNAIRELSTASVDKINNQATSNDRRSVIVTLTLFILRDSCHYKSSQKNAFNKEALQNIEANIGKAKKTIASLEQAVKKITKAMGSYAITLETKKAEPEMLSRWGRMRNELIDDIEFQKKILVKAQNSKKRIHSELSLWVEGVASRFLSAGVKPSKGRGSVGKPTPIVRYMYELLDKEVEDKLLISEQDRVHNLYEGKIETKPIIFTSTKQG